MRFICLALFLAISWVNISAKPVSDPLHPSRLKTHLDLLQHAFEVDYAPALWKLQHNGWTIDEAVSRAKDEIDAKGEWTLKEYQRLMRNLFNSCRDYHVGIFFYSTEEASLPFTVQKVQGRYLICHVDRAKLCYDSYPIEVGDELLLFDGSLPSDAVAKLLHEELISANPSTDIALACELLTHRRGSLGHYVPHGPIAITVYHHKRQQQKSYQLIWRYTPEKIGPSPQLCTRSPQKGVERGSSLKEFLKEEFILPSFQLLLDQGMTVANNNGFVLGGRTSYVPVLGKLWWRSGEDTTYDAYLFESDRGLIGYVRIPSYKGNPQKADEFGRLIDFFQEYAQALVIDQVNNPGGHPLYMYALASMLTDRPLHAPQHRVCITHREVMQAVNLIGQLEKVESDKQAQEVLGETLEGNQVNFQMAQFFLTYMRFILDEWQAGHKLSAPSYYVGMDYINPHPVHRFTKPILLLTNCKDFSGGDFFPAIMQDNQRATILGERTAGAGGRFTASTHLNPYGINTYHLTSSIAERMNKNPIEDLGVTPDILYHLTVEDIQNGFQAYKAKIITTLEELLSK